MSTFTWGAVERHSVTNGACQIRSFATILKPVTSAVQVVVQDCIGRPGLLLHWSVNEWDMPDGAHWPPGTVQAGDRAVQTPFDAQNTVVVRFPSVRTLCVAGCLWPSSIVVHLCVEDCAGRCMS